MRRGGSGRLCLPDAPARPERGCGRSRGEGQSLCHSCRCLVSSPPPPPGRPRRRRRSAPTPPRQMWHRWARPRSPQPEGCRVVAALAPRSHPGGNTRRHGELAASLSNDFKHPAPSPHGVISSILFFFFFKCFLVKLEYAMKLQSFVAEI